MSASAAFICGPVRISFDHATQDKCRWSRHVTWSVAIDGADYDGVSVRLVSGFVVLLHLIYEFGVASSLVLIEG